MNYSDVLNANTENAVVVSRGVGSNGKPPLSVPKGVWQRESHIGAGYNPIIEDQEGPTFSSVDDKAIYTYTIVDRDDALERQLEDVERQIDEKLTEKMLIVQKMGKYSDEVVKTFPSQREEALAYTADNSAPVPLLDALADDEDGETVPVLAGKIIAKSNILKATTGALMKRKNKLSRKAKAAADREALKAILEEELDEGWIV